MSEPAIIAIRMPKWGMAMDEGTVTAWHLPLGAAVRKGDELVEVESAKAASALEAKGDGWLRRQLAAPGDVVQVGRLIGIIALPEVEESTIDAFVAAAGAEAADISRPNAPAPHRVLTASRWINLLESGEGLVTLVLIHGFGGNLANWSLVQAELSERFRIVALDLPGHGDSDPVAADGDLDELAGATLEMLAALGIDSCHLVGHSLGGAVAMALAARAPDRVRSLILVASAGLGSEIDGDYIAGFLTAKRRRDMRPVVERLFHNPSFVSERMLEDLVRMKRLDGAEAGLRRIAEAFLTGDRQRHAGLGAALATLGRPCLRIWGAADRIIPASHAAGGGPSLVLPDAGHMVHVERAKPVARAIADFIDEAERQRG